MRNRTVIALFLAACFLLLARSEALAEQSLQASPRTIYITTKVPASITAPLTISNQTEQEEHISFQIIPFTADENGKIVYPSSPNTSSNSDVAAHIKLFDGNSQIENSLTLLPKQRKILSLKIELSENQKESDYYFSILFISKNASDVSGNASYLQIGVATNVLLTIGSKEPALGTVNEFSAPFLNDRGPIGFKLSVRNNGEHVFTPSGYILITNMFGQTIGKVNLAKTYVFAQSERIIPEDPAKLGKEDLESIKKIDPDSNRAYWVEFLPLGLYKADLYVSFFPNGTINHRTIHFLAFPQKALIIVSLLIVLVFVISIRAKRYQN